MAEDLHDGAIVSPLIFAVDDDSGHLGLKQPIYIHNEIADRVLDGLAVATMCLPGAKGAQFMGILWGDYSIVKEVNDMYGVAMINVQTKGPVNVSPPLYRQLMGNIRTAGYTADHYGRRIQCILCHQLVSIL